MCGKGAPGWRSGYRVSGHVDSHVEGGGRMGGPCGAQCEQIHRDTTEAAASGQVPGDGESTNRDFSLDQGTPHQSRTTPTPQLLLMGDAPTRDLGARVGSGSPIVKAASGMKHRGGVRGAREPHCRNQGRDREGSQAGVAYTQSGQAAREELLEGHAQRRLRTVLRESAAHTQGMGRVPHVHLHDQPHC